MVKNQAAWNSTWPRSARTKRSVPWVSRQKAQKRPSNIRMRCTDCGAQFWEKTQETQMDMHCFRAYNLVGGRRCGPGWHHSFEDAVASGRGKSMYRNPVMSDNVDYWKREYAEDEDLLTQLPD